MATSKLKTHRLLEPDYLAGMLAPVLKGKVKKIKIFPVKVYVTPSIEHIVLALCVTLSGGKSENIFVMGHSSGKKKDLYRILKFFQKYYHSGKWRVPDPLLYDPTTKAIAYRELRGPNLYALFEKKRKNILPIFRSFGRWVADIHARRPSKVFKTHNLIASRAELDPAGIMADIKKQNPEIYKNIAGMINRLAGIQKKLPKTKKRALVHGDLHPENVILLSKNFKQPKLGLIDLELAALADREQDLGSFLEQIEIMAGPHYSGNKINEFQNAFLDSYLESAGVKLNSAIERKIVFYRAFFGLKGAIFYYRLGWHRKMKKILARVAKYLDQLEEK